MQGFAPMSPVRIYESAAYGCAISHRRSSVRARAPGLARPSRPVFLLCSRSARSYLGRLPRILHELDRPGSRARMP